MRVGVFPGSFDPLTTAHLAIADAAIEACRLDHLDLTISTVALAKEHGGHASIEERIAAIERAADDAPVPTGPDHATRSSSPTSPRATTCA